MGMGGKDLSTLSLQGNAKIICKATLLWMHIWIVSGYAPSLKSPRVTYWEFQANFQGFGEEGGWLTGDGVAIWFFF